MEALPEYFPTEHVEVLQADCRFRFSVQEQVRYSLSVILSAIVAASENGVIGKHDWLPWDLPDELQYFRATTMGKPVIMGRKTYDSIGRPMPKRHNIVVSRDTSRVIDGCDVVASVQDAVKMAEKDDATEAFVIGGAQLYEQALPLVDRLYFTRVHTVVEGGDTFMPAVDWSQWKKVSSNEHPADDKHAFAFTMEVYERVR